MINEGGATLRLNSRNLKECEEVCRVVEDDAADGPVRAALLALLGGNELIFRGARRPLFTNMYVKVRLKSAVYFFVR